MYALQSPLTGRLDSYPLKYNDHLVSGSFPYQQTIVSPSHLVLAHHHLHRFFPFLGAAAGSPYIVFILRFCCMALCYGKIYIYMYVGIYIIREATVVLLHCNLYRKYRRSIAGKTFI